MTDAEQIIQRLEDENHLLMGLLCEALSAMPEPRIGRQPGDAAVWRYAGERPIRRLLTDIDRAGALRLVDGGAA